MITKSVLIPLFFPCPQQGILVQVRSEILSDPNASLSPEHSDRPYSEAEAREAFNRMVTRYGWNK